MRRLLSLLIVVSSLASFTACSESKNETPAPDISNDTAITETTENTPEAETKAEAETEEDDEFKVYYHSDFSEINVNITKQKADPPLNIEDISLHNDGSRISRCKESWDPEIEYNKKVKRADDLPEDMRQGQLDYLKEKYESEIEIKENIPAGVIEKVDLHEDTLYFMIDYDDKCNPYISASHCYDICSYNINTKEYKVLYSYDDDEIESSVHYMKCINGKLLFMSYSYYTADNIETKEESTDIFCIDTATGECRDVVTDSVREYLYDYFYVDEFYQFDNKIVIHSFDFDETGFDDEVSLQYYPETDKWEDFYGEEAQFWDSEMRLSNFISGDPVYVTEDEDKTSTFIYPDKFELHTGVRSAHIVAAGKNFIAFEVNSAVERFMYIYNLKKKEVYKYNMTSYSYINSFIVTDNFLVMSGSSGNSKILMPTTGAVFDLSFNSDNVISQDNMIVYAVAEKEKILIKIISE